MCLLNHGFSMLRLTWRHMISHHHIISSSHDHIAHRQFAAHFFALSRRILEHCSPIVSIHSHVDSSTFPPLTNMNQMSVFKNASFQLTRSSQALALMQALFPSTSTSPRPFPQTLCSAAPLLLSNFISETTTNSICSNGCVMLSAFQEDSEQLDNSSRVADAIESNPPPAEGAFMSI